MRCSCGDGQVEPRISVGLPDTCAPLLQPLTLCLPHPSPSPHPLVSTPHLPLSASALRAWRVRKASDSSREDPDFSGSQGEKGQDSGGARAGQMGRTFGGNFISSWNLARFLPALRPSPHGLHGPCLTYPGNPASLDPWKQVPAKSFLAETFPGAKPMTEIQGTGVFLFGPGFWCRKLPP